jgi:hypothetical protein
MSSNDLNAYLNERDELIKQDRALRVDAAKSDTLTSTESAADAVVRAMRAEDAVLVWGAEHEGVELPFPGMEFLTSKAVIMKTKVFDVLHKVRPFLSCACIPAYPPTVVDAKGSVASRPFGCDRRRQFLVESGA